MTAGIIKRRNLSRGANSLAVNITQQEKRTTKEDGINKNDRKIEVHTFGNKTFISFNSIKQLTTLLNTPVQCWRQYCFSKLNWIPAFMKENFDQDNKRLFYYILYVQKSNKSKVKITHLHVVGKKKLHLFKKAISEGNILYCTLCF